MAYSTIEVTTYDNRNIVTMLELHMMGSTHNTPDSLWGIIVTIDFTDPSIHLDRTAVAQGLETAYMSVNTAIELTIEECAIVIDAINKVLLKGYVVGDLAIVAKDLAKHVFPTIWLIATQRKFL